MNAKSRPGIFTRAAFATQWTTARINTSYAVSAEARGLHIGEQIVKDSLKQGEAAGFRILQFNAVVAANVHARHLYERLGFRQIGTIPQGFRMKDGHYEDICPYYHEL